MKKLILIILIALGLIWLGTNASNARRNPATVNEVKTNCKYPYDSSGRLSPNCYGSINKALREGYKVGHDREYPDGSVDFGVR